MVEEVAQFMKKEAEKFLIEVERIEEQQEKIAGSSVVLDRLNSKLSNFEEDPFFLKEQRSVVVSGN